MGIQAIDEAKELRKEFERLGRNGISERALNSDTDKLQFVNSKCINCKVLFPWLEESQFKAKETK